MRSLIASTAFRLWPTYVGLETLMERLHPPVPPPGVCERHLRGYPLRLRFNPASYMGRFLYYRGMYEEGVIRKLSTLLGPGMTFVDVGANVGLYTIIAAHLVGATGRVISFEPQPELIQLFRQNVELNGSPRVILRTVALGCAPGAGKLYNVSASNDGQASLAIRGDEVSVAAPRGIDIDTLDASLDALGIKAVDGVKIDTEGAELEVLRGFEVRLGSNPPRFILLEVDEPHLRRFAADRDQLFSFLRGFGYRIYCLSQGCWHHVRSARDHDRLRHTADFMALHDRVGPTGREI